MSLKLTNSATVKQLEWLKAHEYYGTFKLTMVEATELIDEIMEEERQQRSRPEQVYYDRRKNING